MDTGTINIIINIILTVGLVIIYFHQRNQITTFKTTIKSQFDILESLKGFKELYNPQDFKDYVNLSKEKYKMEADNKVKEVSIKLEKTKESFRNNMDSLFQKYERVYRALLKFIISINPNDRLTVINRIEDPSMKEELKEIENEFKLIYYPPNEVYSFLYTLLLPPNVNKNNKPVKGS